MAGKAGCRGSGIFLHRHLKTLAFSLNCLLSLSCSAALQSWVYSFFFVVFQSILVSFLGGQKNSPRSILTCRNDSTTSHPMLWRELYFWLCPHRFEIALLEKPACLGEGTWELYSYQLRFSQRLLITSALKVSRDCKLCFNPATLTGDLIHLSQAVCY